MHRVERFYENESETVWVLMEDDQGNIHYRDIGYGYGRQIMPAQEFYKDYRKSDLQADRGQ